MHALKRFGMAVAIQCLISVAASAGEIDAKGEQLRSFLDSLGIGQHWLAGQHIEWRTGDPDGKPVSATGSHTHCSAFAAAACERLGVEILHPPEHSQIGLANAQYDWLREKGAPIGWEAVADPAEAQDHANRGDLVVAVFKAPEGKSGHIAIVRPAMKSAAQIEADGPDEIQAGSENYQQTTVKTGFRFHPGAWAHRQILFYWHAIAAFPAAKP